MLADFAAGHGIDECVAAAPHGFVALPDQLSFVYPNALGHRNAAHHVEEAMLNAIS